MNKHTPWISNSQALRSALGILLVLVAAGISPKNGYAEPTSQGRSYFVDAPSEMKRLLKEEDTDHDKKITIEDLKYPSLGAKRPPASFELEDKEGHRLEIKGIYFLSNLLQELKLSIDSGKTDAKVEESRVFENPVHRTSRLIRERYWDGLTRRIDAEHLASVLIDPKVQSPGKRDPQYLYVPYDDEEAFKYFSEAAKTHRQLKLRVERLPSEITKEAADELKAHPGLLTLAFKKNSAGKIEGVPFVVPGGRFNEMYGWDSYFESLGLIVDGRLDLARSMVDNLVYEIRHYGKILNANRTYYLTRSQPPFLTSMIRSVWQSLTPEQRNDQGSRDWLAQALSAAIYEYHHVWTDHNHSTATGLSRYFGEGWGIPPEVEPGHFDPILKPFAAKHKTLIPVFEKLYDTGRIQEPELDRFFINDRAVRESGHDTTYRWREKGLDRCADFVTVDLNSLLYKYEIDIARLIHDEFGDDFKSSFEPGLAASDQKSESWRQKARRRRELILRYLWNPEKKLFFDYNVATNSQSQYLSATTFYPLWSWNSDDISTQILDKPSAKALTESALPLLEEAGGLAATSDLSLNKFGDPKHSRQWDYPNGWAPHQIIAWQGLRQYQFNSDADRLTYRWLYMITRNAADYNGTIPEKFDVVKRSHAVFSEYGNVGTQFSYITKEGFGWMNASYEIGLAALSPQWKSPLENLIPPEWLKFEQN